MKNWKYYALSVLSYVAVAAAAVMVTLAVVGVFGGSSKLDQLEKYLLYYYVDEADRTKLQDAAAEAMVKALGNRWCYYIPADEYAAYLEDKNNAYVGIGVTIRSDEKGYTVVKLAEGGPAEESGILVEDLIIRVDGTALEALPPADRTALISGKEGTTVEITVLRAGEEKTFTVTRRTVKVKVATGMLLEGGYGLVTIRNFNTSCYTETVAVIEDLRQQGATSLIFDVRNNGGGYVDEMIKLLDYLLPEGVLYRSEDYRGKTDIRYSDASCLDMPMAVLVNGSSYSAAEFFAAVLEEYDAAVLAGEKTSGKGYFQNTFQLKDGSAVAISTGKYTTPGGVNLEGVGLTPEVYVEVDKETADAIYAGTLAPEADPQILAAINALKSAKEP